MMVLFLKQLLRQDSLFQMENIILEMQVFLLHRGVLYLIEEYDIIFENGEKVMNGTISMWKTTLIFLVLKMRRSYLIYVIPVYEMLLKEYLAY